MSYGQHPGFIPQQQPVSPLAQQVARGEFPYHNRIEVVGQVFPTQSCPQGKRWVEAREPGKDGHAEIILKLRKSWISRSNVAGVKQSKVKLVIYGPLGQTLLNQAQPGMIIRAIGELVVSNFQAKQGQNAGQWITSVNIEIRDGRNGEIPFESLGMLPVQDESRQQPQYGAPAPQQYQQQYAPNQYPPQAPAQPQAPQYPPQYPPQAPAQQYPAAYPPAQPQYNAPAAPPPYSPTAPAAYPPPMPPQQLQYPQQPQQPHYPPQQPQQQVPQQQYAPQPQPAAPGAPAGTFLPMPQGAANPPYQGGGVLNPSEIPF